MKPGQAKKLIGKTITVRSMHFEQFDVIFTEQEKPYSQSFWYITPTNKVSRGLINVTLLELIEVKG